MSRFFSAILLAAGMCLLLASSAMAEGAPKLKGEMVAHKIVVNEKNEEVAVSADKVYPDDTIEYALRYRNVGDMPASGVSLIGIIPEGTTYIENSATAREPFEVLYSIDGGKSYHRAPLEYTVVGENGVKEKRVATPDMYTNIKWLMSGTLDVDKEVVVRYRVRVK